jgi:hypothetical protein
MKHWGRWYWSHLQIASDIQGRHSPCYSCSAMPPRSKTPVPRSKCPVSCALDLIGDRSPEGIPTNILADRLKRMVEYGIATSTPYSERPLRLEYSLTEKGEGLRPVILEMVEWGVRYAGGRRPKL